MGPAPPAGSAFHLSSPALATTATGAPSAVPPAPTLASSRALGTYLSTLSVFASDKH
ncbi:hypothetical protein T484DRAFT_1795145 [Baffinella frigidus]|nr:hypothetical protein T484DRAFT_1795145 [Cryptophyta sp. CCMP2293]